MRRAYLGLVFASAACAGPAPLPDVASPPRPSASAAAPEPRVARGRGTLWDTTPLAASSSHTCAIRARGRVACWGRNETGQIGDGSTADRPSPQLVEGVDGATAVSVGPRQSCAIVDAGRVLCWGGATVRAGRALGVVEIGNIEDAVEVVSSTWVSCARHRTGKVDCWTSDALLWRVNELERATQLAAGTDEICALTPEGTVKCAAALTHGGGTSPARPVDDVKGAIAIAAAGASACALMPTGTVRCWSFAKQFDEQLPTSSAELPGLEGVVDLVGLTSHICAATDQGAKCFRDVHPVRSAKGTPTIQDVALDDAPELRRFRSLAGGFGHRCGETADGAISCWGHDDALLGSYSRADTNPTPKKVAGIDDAVELFASGDATCARRSNGHVACWGMGAAALDGSTRDDRASDVPGIDDAKRLEGGSQFVCAVRKGPKPSCWGRATWRSCRWESPDNCQPERLATPIAVDHLLDVPGAVAIGDDCALRGNGTVACSTREPRRPPPTTIESLRNAKALAGWCALDGAGAVDCWGRNELGQLGDGSTYSRPDARQVLGLAKAKEIAAGRDHACALLEDGTVRCWGAGSNGQLGDGSRLDRLVPVPVEGLAHVAHLSLGARHSCAVLDDGTARCWGANDHGALGDGSFRDQSKPAVVSGITDAVEIAAGERHGCVRLRSGGVSCWGATRASAPVATLPDSPRRVPEPDGS